MALADAQLSATEVLRAFHHDEPYLFLGAAFSTVAILCGAYCALRRRFDALLICLAIFAYLYGQRLWLESEVLRIALQHNEFFTRLRVAINYLVPVPALIFFEAAGLMGRRGKPVVAVLSAMFLGLVVATFAMGARPEFNLANNVLVAILLFILVLRSVLWRNADRDFKVLRFGLLCFVLPALWDNIAGPLWGRYQIEPYGFAVLLGSLGYIAARRTLEREAQLGEIEKELELARRIQRSILPAAFPASTCFDVAARYLPMTSVAGDLYDFVVAERAQAGLLIADVSGHGVPAALIASMVKMAATAQRSHAADPAELLSRMNAALCGNTQNEYVTAAYVHLDAQSGELRYAAAGHPPMLLVRGGAVEEIAENGLLLGVTGDAVFTSLSQPLCAGDRFVLYTDGIVEARNSQGQLFGDDALHAALRETARLRPAEAADKILDAVQSWSRAQDDDLTLLVCDYLGASAPAQT